MLSVYLLGDVYIQPTQDNKNPVIYGVFSVSGWVTDSFLRLSNFHAVLEGRCILVSAWRCQLSLILKCCVAYGLSDSGYKDKTGCESGAQRESRSSERLTEPIVPHRSGLIASCHSTHSIKIQGEATRHINWDSDCTQAGRGAHRVIINTSWLMYLRNKYCYFFHPLLRLQARLNPADKNTCSANDRGPWQELQT